MKGKKKDRAEEKNKLQWGPKKSFANPAESLEVIISHQSSSALDWNHQGLCTLHFSVTGYRLLQYLGKGSFWHLRRTLKKGTSGSCLVTILLVVE